MSENNILENIRVIDAEDFIAEYSRPADFWVGCADCSFSPADYKGKHADSFIFHQNAGNLVQPTDLNCLSAMQFAVKIEQAENIFICGHYDCRLVASILGEQEENPDFLSNWLNPLRRIAEQYKTILEDLPLKMQIDILCRLSAVMQAFNAGCSSVVRQAWSRGQTLTVRAVIFNPENNSFSDLGFSAESFDSLNVRYRLLMKAMDKYQDLKTFQKSCKNL